MDVNMEIGARGSLIIISLISQNNERERVSPDINSKQQMFASNLGCNPAVAAKTSVFDHSCLWHNLRIRAIVSHLRLVTKLAH